MSETVESPKKTKKQQKTDKFPCPSCGGDMQFNPERQKLECIYCGSTIDIKDEGGDIKEYNIEDGLNEADQDWGMQTRVVKCETCGGETVLEGNNTSLMCAYCGSTHVVAEDELPGIKPESVVPFRIDKKTANNKFKKWISKRWLAPNALKKEYSADKLKGLYIPYWTYDSQTNSTYTAQAGTYYYVTETRTKTTDDGKTQTVTEQVRKTRWTFVSGTYGKFFDDVLINASKQINESIISKVEPFDLNDLLSYAPHYLAGFGAERYSVDLKDGWEKAKGIIKRDIHHGVVQQINADEVRGVSINTLYSDVKYKHFLLPIWISAYTFKKKVYQFMVNGQTGKVAGKAPKSFWKMSGLILGICALVALIYFIAQQVG